MLTQERMEAMARELGIDPQKQTEDFATLQKFLREASETRIKDIPDSWQLPEAVRVYVDFQITTLEWFVAFDRRRVAQTGVSDSVLVVFPASQIEFPSNLSRRDIAGLACRELQAKGGFEKVSRVRAWGQEAERLWEEE